MKRTSRVVMVLFSGFFSAGCLASINEVPRAYFNNRRTIVLVITNVSSIAPVKTI